MGSGRAHRRIRSCRRKAELHERLLREHGTLCRPVRGHGGFVLPGHTMHRTDDLETRAHGHVP